jgi:hypothetical protein
MTDNSFRRMAGFVAVVSLPFAVGNLLTIALAVHFNLNALSNPLLLIHTGAAGARWWHWSMILDSLGYYLMIVPLILLLRGSSRPDSRDWTDFFVLCLLAYCFIGAVGGAILATAVPPLITSYSAASPAHRAIVETVGTGYSNAVYRGLWNLLEEFLAGIGWIGIGLLTRAEDRRLRTVTIALGAACFVDAVGTALNIDAVAMVGLTLYLVLAPLWASWLGVRLLRDRTPAGTGTFLCPAA